MSRIFLEVEKVLVSHLVEDLGSQTGIPNSLEKKKIPEWEGLTILEFGGHGG